MIIRLTYLQHQRIQTIVPDWLEGLKLESMRQWLEQDVTAGSKHRVDVMMPAVAWKVLWEEVMFDHCYNNQGRARDGVRTTDINALRNIRTGLNIREKHPAIHRMGAIGMANEVVPAWKVMDGSIAYHYTPYPDEGEFVVLAPETRQLKKQRVTIWTETDKFSPSPLFDPGEHRAFV